LFTRVIHVQEALAVDRFGMSMRREMLLVVRIVENGIEPRAEYRCHIGEITETAKVKVGDGHRDAVESKKKSVLGISLTLNREECSAMSREDGYTGMQ